MTILFILMITLMLLLKLVKLFRNKIKALLTKILQNTFYNNIIRSFNISYLKVVITFAVIVHLDRSLPKMLPLLLLGIIPLLALKMLWIKKDTLNTKETKQKIERMYQDVHLTRNQWTICYYPSFLIRRYLFVIIPILISNYPALYLQALIMLNLFYLMFYAGVRPHMTLQRTIKYCFNEYMVLFISLHMLCFTDFLNHSELQYQIGYSFILLMLIVFIINIIYMIHNNLLKVKRKTKKR